MSVRSDRFLTCSECGQNTVLIGGNGLWDKIGQGVGRGKLTAKLVRNQNSGPVCDLTTGYKERRMGSPSMLEQTSSQKTDDVERPESAFDMASRQPPVEKSKGVEDMRRPKGTLAVGGEQSTNA